MADEKSGSISSSIVALPDFPGEEVLSHEGRMWKAAAITKFAAHELISVVETGVHPAMNEIIIVDVDNELPMLAPQDPQYHRRLSERKRIEMQSATNRERIKRLTYKAWNVAFESLRQACVKNALLLAF